MPRPHVSRKSAKPKRSLITKAIPVSYHRYLKLALSLPGAEESTCYGTPAVRVKGKILSRLRIEAEGGLALRCDFLDRQILLQSNPDAFFLVDHYRNSPAILIRLNRIGRVELSDVVTRAWRIVAPKRLVEAYDAELAQRGS